MRFLLDTCVISEPGKKSPNPKVLNWLLQHEANSGIPTLAIAEWAQGIYWLPVHEQPGPLARLKTLMTDHADSIVPFDTDAAIEWGKYVASTRQTPKGIIDSQIAAIALSRGLTVVTRDAGGFPQVNTFNPFE
jgi:predicted nucleic acid-binding protein